MARRRTILIVDDAKETLELLERRLEARGFAVALASSVDEAARALARTPFDLVITDLKMPGKNGMDLVHHVREKHQETAVVMVTGYATIQGAVDAVKSGVAEYLAKPFTNAELQGAVDRALARCDEARRARAAREGPAERFGLVGTSSGMRVVFAALEEARATDRPVLLVGEPGTGRRASARAILAARTASTAGAPGALLDLDASDFRMLEVAGAAGAGGALLRRAERLEPEAFPRLKKLAASLARRGVRLFASASPAVAEKGGRRLDWDALAAHRVYLPPLRERRVDILPLATRFAAGLTRSAPPEPLLAPDVVRAFDAYAWPGNLAELEQVVADALALSHGETIAVADLPTWLRPARGAAAEAERSLADVELEHIARVLRHTRGNRSRAAEILGINRRTLGEKLKDQKK